MWRSNGNIKDNIKLFLTQPCNDKKIPVVYCNIFMLCIFDREDNFKTFNNFLYMFACLYSLRAFFAAVSIFTQVCMHAMNFV